MGCKDCLTKFFADADDGAKRARWMSRSTFILAMVGYCVGLGNFWRFPYLCFTWGGALFFIPYFACLLTIGIPVTLMELSLGQKFQRGDIGVFRGIHPRLSGVGLASVFAAFVIVAYYNIIIGWSLIYLIMSFMSPLPWSSMNLTPGTNYKDCEDLFIT
jgi:SNF family Na+-dependent transporter